MRPTRKPAVNRYYSLPNIPLSGSTSTYQLGKKSSVDIQPYYKVTYPLRNRKKYGIKDDCNAAPNAEYTVTGRGYTFRRHNNKYIMNINTDIFFDDKPVPMSSSIKPKHKSDKTTSPTLTMPPITTKKHQMQHPTQKPQDQRTRFIEEKNRILFSLAAQLHEQKHLNKQRAIKLTEECEARRKEMLDNFEKEKRDLIEAQEKEFFECEAQHAKELDDQCSKAKTTQLILKNEIQQIKERLREIKATYDEGCIKDIQQMEETLTILYEKEIEELDETLTKDLKQQRELRCEKLEKHYEEQLDVQTADYLKKMEELAKFENYKETEQKLKTTQEALKNVKMEVAHLKHEGREMDRQITKGEMDLKELKKKLADIKIGKAHFEELDEKKWRNSKKINDLRMEIIDIKRTIRRTTEELYHISLKERECLDVQKPFLGASFTPPDPRSNKDGTVDLELEDTTSSSTDHEENTNHGSSHLLQHNKQDE